MKLSNIIKSQIRNLKCSDWSNETEYGKYKVEFDKLNVEYTKVRTEEIKKNKSRQLEKANKLGISVILTKSKEKNDCVVVSYSLVKDISYEESHRIFKELGRKDNCPVHNVDDILCKLGMIEVMELPIPSEIDWNQRWIYRIKTQLNQGKYLISVAGHCFAIIDGAIHDSKPGLNRHIRSVWKII